MRFEVAAGRVVNELASMLRSARFDGVMVGGQGHGGASEKFLGSTARRLVRQTTVPAYVVKRTGSMLPTRVLCAIDVEEPARAALSIGKDLAERFSLALETLTVIQTDSWPFAAHFPAEFSGVLASEWHQEATRACAKSAKALREYEVEILGVLASKAQHADYGPAASSIVRHGERYDTVILGARPQARPNLTTFGSTIEAVLERSVADVLIAR